MGARTCSRCGTAYAGGERFCSFDGAAIVDPRAVADPLIGQTLGGRYLLKHAIGRGGMGVVYEAEHVGLGKRIAIKLLIDQFSEDREVLARFHQEARTASRIGHENIIDILDIGDHDGRSYIAMELLEGADLRRAFVAAGARLSLARTLPILRQIVRGLGAAHDKGVIHRDMKPENVFLTERGDRADFVKIMDFGISKIKAAHDSQVRLTQTGAVIGTPMYMAPEQGLGRPDIDHRADIYSVGVMMYELLAGRPPFQAATYLGLMTEHLQSSPPPLRQFRPELSPSLEAVVLRALEKDPAQRFANMHQLGEALAAAASTGVESAVAPTVAPAAVTAPSAATSTRSSRARAAALAQAGPTTPAAPPGRTLGLGAGLAAAVLVLAVVVVLVVRARPSPNPAPTLPAVAKAPAEAAPSIIATGAPGPSAAGAVRAPAEVASAAATMGTLEVDSTPRGATVVLDGEERGHTPLVIERVATGDHRVRLILAGYEPIDLAKPIRAGITETFFGALTRSSRGLPGAAGGARPGPRATSGAGTDPGTADIARGAPDGPASADKATPDESAAADKRTPIPAPSDKPATADKPTPSSTATDKPTPDRLSTPPTPKKKPNPYRP
jgi:serine/threonine-protein kinase